MKRHHRLCPYKPAQRTECDTHGMGTPDMFGNRIACAAMHYTPEIPCQCDLVLKVEADAVDRAADALARVAAAGRHPSDLAEWTHTASALAEILRCKAAA